MPVYKLPNGDTFRRDREEQADESPVGCVQITEEEYQQIVDSRSVTSTHDLLAADVLLDMKRMRMEIFRVLDTLQVDALTSGNTQHAIAIMQAKAAMTALNNIDLSGHQTAEAMKQAIQLAYWGIVSQAPQAVQDAFNALVPR